MKNITIFFFALVVLMGIGCETGKETTSSEGFTYAHLAHTRIRDTVNQKLDPREEQLDFSKFDLLLLGGDLCEDSSEELETVEYLDSILDLGSPDVHWAIGNHDNTNLDYVEKVTKRSTNYTFHRNGITFVVLNSHTGAEDWMINVSEEQREMVQNISDTIQNSTHLVVLTHKLIWILGHPEMKKHQGKNMLSWTCNYGIANNNWNEVMLPILQRTQRKGVQVICVAGDLGNNAKEFEEFASDGIVYLASGINPVDDDVKFLLFNHTPPELNWEFVELEKYLAAGQNWKVTRKVDLSPN
jgi:hypothetical protein